jgi:hypothetical protein
MAHGIGHFRLEEKLVKPLIVKFSFLIGFTKEHQSTPAPAAKYPAKTPTLDKPGAGTDHHRAPTERIAHAAVLHRLQLITARRLRVGCGRGERRYIRNI